MNPLEQIMQEKEVQHMLDMDQLAEDIKANRKHAEKIERKKKDQRKRAKQSRKGNR